MQTQMGKLNQILFLVDRSDTIESCFINTKKETFQLYYSRELFKDGTCFIQFKFNELNDAIEWLKELIKTEIKESYELSNMEHRNYIRYYK